MSCIWTSSASELIIRLPVASLLDYCNPDNFRYYPNAGKHFVCAIFPYIYMLIVRVHTSSLMIQSCHPRRRGRLPFYLLILLLNLAGGAAATNSAAFSFSFAALFVR